MGPKVGPHILRSKTVNVGGVGGGGCLCEDQNSSCSEADQISGACQFRTFISFPTLRIVTNMMYSWTDDGSHILVRCDINTNNS